MKPFIINTYDYNPAVGGIKVMHKLCDLLNNNGFESYLMPIHLRDEFYTCSDYNTPLVTNELLNDLDNCIVLYPEGIHYNPLNAKNVVRWILGPSHLHDAKTYGKSDLVYWYMDYYYNDYLGQRDNKLFVSEFHDNIFTNKNYERNGNCYTIRKANPTQLIHPENSILISWEDAGKLEWLSNLFNITKKFYSYDTYTFLSVQAAMCGCISIVVPDPNIPKEKWLSGSRLSKYGIAYGEEDIPRALETLPLLFKEIDKINLEMKEQVIKFAEHCNKVFE